MRSLMCVGQLPVTRLLRAYPLRYLRALAARGSLPRSQYRCCLTRAYVSADCSVASCSSPVSTPRPPRVPWQLSSQSITRNPPPSPLVLHAAGPRRAAGAGGAIRGAARRPHTAAAEWRGQGCDGECPGKPNGFGSGQTVLGSPCCLVPSTYLVPRPLPAFCSRKGECRGGAHSPPLLVHCPRL